jgi:hypothetical protein
MDTAALGAISAVLGSAVGGAASITSAWFTQRTQGHRERVRAEIQKREVLYSEFIAECSNLALDALTHSSMGKPESLVKVYALHNRIRLVSSDAVVDAAGQAIRGIIELYLAPNVAKEQLEQVVLKIKDDPLKVFSETCREEFRRLDAGG